ncbi:hypothetical protein L9Z73_00320 [Pseudomonas sp. TNT11]|uniref:Phage tail protein n=1 Tax=Pseudomonas emilianonis TaxID=2915812 RepID=A0ABT0EBI8_9PSED|nr:hypothetical protein [Pseudomonas emilianonis]MCK1782861.1 hypothetical protein [Pseudomonas emilianonis]
MMKFILLEGGAVGAIAAGVDIDIEAVRLGGIVIDAEDYVEPPYVPSKEELIATETQWRNSEMPKVQQTVTAIEYGEEGIQGTAQQWQLYWRELRKWTESNPDFPSASKRPVQPA